MILNKLVYICTPLKSSLIPKNNIMKTTTIDMSKANGKNVFTNAVWKKATDKEISEAFAAIGRVKNSRVEMA